MHPTRIRLCPARRPAVDITAESTGGPLFDGVPCGESGYVEAPGGDGTVRIRGDAESNDGDVVADFGVSLERQADTGFVAEHLTPDDEPADVPFDLVLARDADGGT